MVYALAARTARPYRLDVAPPTKKPTAPKPPSPLTAAEFVQLAEKATDPPPPHRLQVARRGRVIVRSQFMRDR